ncbi:GL12608 [Drosophila persimilis]|uniref:GL12608 n=1 Tax=Drosophila persimilis TaxID=7234 RepID=B4GLN8_DROPE|nr:ATP-dependent DNA helicase 2 subunit 1 [Drosophila persimilis]EDW38462.1 GL12608 [Drosophila persimilis]
MSTWNPANDVDLLSGSEDEEDIAMKRDYHGREAILFVVDANLQTAGIGRLMEALNIIRTAFISGMLVNDKDLIGLVFANTKHSPLPLEASCVETIVVPENCAVFLPLRQLTKPIVEHYLEFMGTVESQFATEYGLVEPDGRGKFDLMIRLCIELLEKCGKKLNNAKIAYVTDVDTPHLPSSNEFQAALQKAIDLEGKEFEFHVIPMNDDFDYCPFYKEFITLSRAIELDAFVEPDPSLLREMLADRKLKQDFLRRCLGHFAFHLGPNLSMSVQYYNYFQRRALPRKVQIMRRDNSVVSTKRQIIVRKHEGEEIKHEYQMKANQGWYKFDLGEKSLRLTMTRMDMVRNMHKPHMQLLGFKHRSALPEVLYSKPSNFMYPDDQSIIGSKRLFRGLWERCLQREKIIVCLFMSKRKSIPRYVVLVPVQVDKSEVKSYRSQLCGDGFKIVYLPEAKHIRHIDMCDWNNTANSADDEKVDFFQKIIKRLRIDYQPNLINDPSLDYLQANLLALSLDITTDSKGIDELLDTTAQDKRIEKYMPDYERLFDVEAVPSKKRPAKASANGASSSKMPKIDMKQIESYEFVEYLIAEERLTSCTVAQLQWILQKHFDENLPKSSPKDRLVKCIVALSAGKAGT